MNQLYPIIRRVRRPLVVDTPLPAKETKLDENVGKPVDPPAPKSTPKQPLEVKRNET